MHSARCPLCPFDEIHAHPEHMGKYGRHGRAVDVGTCTLDHSLDEGAMRHHDSSRHSNCLAQSAHPDESLTAQARMLQRAMSLRAKNAHTMGVIDHQPGIVTLGQSQQSGQIRDIPVHAEHGVGHDQPDGRCGLLQHLLKPVEPTMGIALHAGLCQQTPIDQGSMVELVGKDHGLIVPQRRHECHVGHESAAEEQPPRFGNVSLLPAGSTFLDGRMGLRMAAHQVRSPTAYPPAPGPFCHSLDQSRMLGQAEIVVAAEGEQRRLAPFQLLNRATGRQHGATSAAQGSRIGLMQLPVQMLHQHRRSPRHR